MPRDTHEFPEPFQPNIVFKEDVHLQEWIALMRKYNNHQAYGSLMKVKRKTRRVFLIFPRPYMERSYCAIGVYLYEKANLGSLISVGAFKQNDGIKLIMNETGLTFDKINQIISNNDSRHYSFNRLADDLESILEKRRLARWRSTISPSTSKLTETWAT